MILLQKVVALMITPFFCGIYYKRPMTLFFIHFMEKIKSEEFIN